MPHKAQTHLQSLRKGPSHRVRPAGNFYGLKQWLDLRTLLLNRQPLCADPFGHHLEDAREEPATEVDHIVSRAERPDLQFVMSNLQALCKSCHSKKTRKE